MKRQWHNTNTKQRIALLLLGSVLVMLMGCAVYPRRRVVVVDSQKVVYVREAPPAPRVEARPARPGAKAVWVDGHWQWNGRKYVWVSGHWEVNPRGKWVAGHWDKRLRGWVWVPGHWR